MYAQETLKKEGVSEREVLACRREMLRHRGEISLSAAGEASTFFLLLLTYWSRTRHNCGRKPKHIISTIDTSKYCTIIARSRHFSLVQHHAEIFQSFGAR